MCHLFSKTLASILLRTRGRATWTTGCAGGAAFWARGGVTHPVRGAPCHMCATMTLAWPNNCRGSLPSAFRPSAFGSMHAWIFGGEELPNGSPPPTRYQLLSFVAYDAPGTTRSLASTLEGLPRRSPRLWPGRGARGRRHAVGVAPRGGTGNPRPPHESERNHPSPNDHTCASPEPICACPRERALRNGQVRLARRSILQGL